MQSKNDAFYEKVKHPSPQNIAKYSKLKKITDKHVEIAKKNFYSDYFKKHQSDSKRQWEMINSLLNRNNKRAKIDKIRDCDGNVATSPQVIADKFNDYFANIAKKLKSELPGDTGNSSQFLGSSVTNSIYLTPTNCTEVSEIIDDLKINATADINVASIKRPKMQQQNSVQL